MGNYGILLIILMLIGLVYNNSTKSVKNSEEDNSDAPDQAMRQLQDILNPQKKARKTRQTKKNIVAKTQPNTTSMQPKTQPILETNEVTLATADKTKSRIEEISEDFTIEKAVIFSEILNPKYKEY